MQKSLKLLQKCYYSTNIRVQYKFKFSSHTKFNRFIIYLLRIQYLTSKIFHILNMRLYAPLEIIQEIKDRF